MDRTDQVQPVPEGSQPKWTPGPWALHRPNGARLHVIGPDSYAIALIYNQGANNARLIAAAPELYKALAGLLTGHPSGDSEAQKIGRAALAKARGEL